MKRTIDILKANASDSASVWRSEASEHRDNWCWMRYSMEIAVKVRSRMRECGLTQVGLAEKIGCSQQYVSLLLKGKENLTLETIAKLESALDLQLLCISSDSVRKPLAGYLNESDPEPYGDE